MFKGIFFVLRIAIAWALLFIALLIVLLNTIGAGGGPFVLAAFILGTLVIIGAVSHVRRVRLIAGHVDDGTLRSRQRRQIEIPFEADDAFDMLDAAVRELPRSEEIESARDSLQLRAKVGRPQVYGRSRLARLNPASWFGNLRNQVTATVTPGGGTGSVTLICEPEAGAWSDWFRVDDGTNFENAEAITRAITRRIAERRRNEQRAAEQTATEKELSVARLNLLHAQIEPHFLYNTLANAQVLTRSRPTACSGI
jgi:hypothetical protein